MSVAAPHTANAQSSDARKQDAPTIATEQVGAYEATGVGGLALSGGVAGLVLGRRGDAEGDEDEGEAMNIGGVAVATDSALGTTLDKLRRRANADPSHGAIARADAAGPGGATMDALRRRAVDGEAGAGGSRGSTGRASAGPVPRARPATFISYESGPSRADSPRQDDAETLGGAASVASATDTKAARWHPHGRFAWWVKWRTDGRSGWITQKVTNTYAGTDANGTAITNASTGTEPSYYESWAVSAGGTISPSAGPTHDMWERIGLGAGSRGTWSMKGEVYWTDTDPAGSGHASGGVGNAGILVAGTNAPAGLGKLLATRTANGDWDSTGAKPKHTGSAA